MTSPREPASFNPGQPRFSLTGREWDIVRLIAEDLSNQEIADKFTISVKTVESHIRHIFVKLGAISRAGVARWVHEQQGALTKHVPADQPRDDLKPNPLAARTDAQLERLLRRFWIWSGRPACRKIAVRAGEGVFSHTTISKLLNDRPGTPPLRLEYVQGVIRGCGGDESEEELWAMAWRRIHLGVDH